VPASNYGSICRTKLSLSHTHTHTHTRALFMEKRRMQPLKVEHTHTLKGLNEFCIR